MFVALGRWRNFEDLEDSLSVQELEAIILELRDSEERKRTFLAAIEGIDLGKNATDGEFERVKREAEAEAMKRMAKKHNTTVDAIEFASIGLDVEIEE